MFDINHQWIEGQKFTSFEEASASILRFMSSMINMNTLFIAKNDQQINEMVKVYNKDKELLHEGDQLPFNDTLCKRSVDHGHDPLIIKDLNANTQTMNLKVTKSLGGGSFIGVPIYYENGEIYGTICGLDTENVIISEEQITMFKTMASLLTYILELDLAQRTIQDLSAPVVPFVEGVAILPLIGTFNDSRAQFLLDTALNQCQALEINYLIIDLSGTTTIDQSVAGYLSVISQALQLIGINVIITGLTPKVAMNVAKKGISLGETSFYSTLKKALKSLGFTIKREANRTLHKNR